MPDYSSELTKFQNEPFKYPKPHVKFLEAQKTLDSLSSESRSLDSQNVDGYKFYIHRGFMKNLQPATLTDTTSLGVCYFQFNPQEIRQNVSMREDIYNPVILTPEQLAQPIGGTVNFQFDLLFDRSTELTRRPFGSNLSNYPGNDPEDDSGVRPANDIADKDASRIGVYADLKVLYNIIGQGLSDATIDLQLEMLRGTYNAKIARENAYNSKSTTDSTDPNGNTTTTTTTPEVIGDPFTNDFTDKEALTKLFRSNIGNAAFLLPNPVRIVFSPLLMVDGFVTSTNVDFLKFTNEMIPMQCRVGLSVNALYVGFTKQRTFLTSTIDTAIKSLEEEQATDTAAVNLVEKELLKISPFRLALAGQPTESWDEAMYSGPGFNQLIYFIVGNSGSSTVRTAYTGFPFIKPKDAQGRDLDPILTLYEDSNTSFTITYEWRYRIYGKVGQNQNNGVGYTYDEAKSRAYTISTTDTVFANGESKSAIEAVGGVLVGDYSESLSASSKEGWGSGRSGNGADEGKIRRRTYRGMPNNSPSPLTVDYTGSTRYTNILNSYYIIKADLKITLTSGTISRTYKPTSSKWNTGFARGSDPTGVTTSFSGNPVKITDIPFSSTK